MSAEWVEVVRVWRATSERLLQDVRYRTAPLRATMNPPKCRKKSSEASATTCRNEHVAAQTPDVVDANARQFLARPSAAPVADSYGAKYCTAVQGAGMQAGGINRDAFIGATAALVADLPDDDLVAAHDHVAAFIATTIRRGRLRPSSTGPASPPLLTLLPGGLAEPTAPPRFPDRRHLGLIR